MIKGNKMTPAQSALLERIKSRGGAMQRKHLATHEIAIAWRLVDLGRLIVDGGDISSRGPFNQAAQDTLTFMVEDARHD